jgi:WD40 repeat protein
VTVVEATTQALPLEDPYVGLTHFTEEYADFFFGREAESSLIIGNLRAARLTLLYAQSGVGKSSVLRAGVVARMREVAAHDMESRGTPRLVPVVFSSWSEQPVAALVHAIDEAILPYLGEADPPELPKDDLEAALEAASEALGATMLVILDQFEEYFLYPDEEPEAERIAVQIARCVNRPDLRANFLISIREDAYAELGDLFRGKVKNVYGNFLHLDFLNRAGAREAIERPIQRLNELQPEAEPYSVEPGLVEAVLGQVGHDEEDDRIETTYLQLVMRRLWEEETGAGSRVLRLATLERLGGAQAIIGSHLDRAMEGGGEAGDGLTGEQRLIAAAAFRFLVTSGGTKIALTAADLAELTGFSDAEIQPVLRHLSSPRLHILRPVVFDQEGSEPRYEIFHDALAEPIREWRMRVEEQERNARRERERAEKEEAEKIAAAAERRAQRERQRRRVAQGLLAVAVLALLIFAAVFVVKQTNLANQNDADRQSVEAAERISELAWAPSFGPAAAALASVEAYGLSPTEQARERALAQLQLNPGLPEVFAGHTRGVESVSFWPGSDQLVSGGDKTVRLWDWKDGEPKGLVADGDVLEVAVSPARSDGSRVIAAGLQTGEVKLWEVPAGGEPQALAEPVRGSQRMRGVAFDPRDPERLAVGGSEGRVALWDLADPEAPQEVNSENVPGDVEDLSFAPDGSRLLVASTGAGTIIGVSDDGLGSSEAVTHDPESAVAAAPDGSYAFGGRGGVQLWVAGGRQVRLGLPGRVNALVFAEGGSVLVSAGTDWNVTTWDLKTKRPFGPPRTANRAAVNDVAVSSEGEIAAAGEDRLVKVWPLEPGWTLATTLGALSPGESGKGVPKIFDVAGAGRQKIAAAAGPAGTLVWPLSPWGSTDRPTRPTRLPGASFAVASNGRTMLVTGRGNSFVVYATEKACPGERDYCRRAVPSHPFSEAPVSSLYFASPGDRLLLVSNGEKGGEGVANLWDLTDALEDGRIEHLSSMSTPSRVFAATLSRKEPIVAAATRSGRLALWDVSEPKKPREFKKVDSGESQALYAAAFSDDGTLLATGGQGQQVMLWEVAEESGEPALNRLPGTMLQRQSIKSLVFSPDAETLAAADAEGNVCLYEVEDRHLIGDRSCLRGYNTSALPNGGIEAAKFGYIKDEEGRDTTVLFTAGRGQPVVAWHSLLWNLNDTDVVEQAIDNDVCRLADRNLKGYEWRAVFEPTDLAGDRDKTCSDYSLPE